MHRVRTAFLSVAGVFLLFGLVGCATTYYNTMEKVGIHKRDIMVSRVEKARDSQEEARQQFSSALEQFGSVVALQATDLKQAYDKFNDEYEHSKAAAEEVSRRIEKVEAVSEALFEEWQEELELYQNDALRRSSEAQLRRTRTRYDRMLTNMHRAEDSMAPVLLMFRDNVLFLKHNLNAQAIGSLRGEFDQLQGEISVLVKRMNEAIEASNAFIAEIKS